MRIVSLLPAATEIVLALGLGEELAGVTHRCEVPPHAGDPLVVTRGALDGAPDTLVEDALQEAAPDLVIAGEGDGGLVGTRAVEALYAAAETPPSILTLAPTSVEGVLNGIVAVGAMTEAEDDALGVVEELRERLKGLEEIVMSRRDHGFAPPRVLVLGEVDPPATVGRWIPDQVRLAGGWEILGGEGERPAPTSWEAVRDMSPRSSCCSRAGCRSARRSGPGRRCRGRRAGRSCAPSATGVRSWSTGRASLRRAPGSSTASRSSPSSSTQPPSTACRRPPPGHGPPDPRLPMSYRATLGSLWCGTTWTTRGPNDLEGWALLCPTCLGKAGSNPFLKGRLRKALAERVGASQVVAAAAMASAPDRAVPHRPGAAAPRPEPARHPSSLPAYPAFPDDWFLRRGAFERGAIHDAAWAAELDMVTRWLDGLPLAGRIVEPAAGVGF